MTLHLIRHGKTDANEKRLYCGSTDIPLCENGIQELSDLKKQIAYPIAELVIVSGLLRTVQTANILFDNPAIIEIPALREICFGDFEMQSYEELKTVPSYQRWISQLNISAPPGGESRPDFVKRVMRGLSEVESIIRSKSANNAIIVTHGGVIATIMEFLLPGQRDFYDWQPDCGKGLSLCTQSTHYIGVCRWSPHTHNFPQGNNHL